MDNATPAERSRIAEIVKALGDARVVVRDLQSEQRAIRARIRMRKGPPA